MSDLGLFDPPTLPLWPERQYNPRYVAYARAQGMTPDEMLESDALTYPGGKMTGFILWLNAKWREWDRLNGRREPHSDADHQLFDAWLEGTR